MMMANPQGTYIHRCSLSQEIGASARRFLDFLGFAYEECGMETAMSGWMDCNPNFKGVARLVASYLGSGFLLVKPAGVCASSCEPVIRRDDHISKMLRICM
jgi:hypothetical protein